MPGDRFSAAAIVSMMRRASRWLAAVHSREHLAAKTSGLSSFSVVASTITGLFVSTTWIWDYAIDPAHMPDVFGLRMAEAAAVFLLAAVMAVRPNGRLVRAALFLVPAFVQVTFIEVLSRLDGGPSYGVGGFLYFFIFVPFMAHAQSLRFTAILLAFIGVFPNVLRLVGVGEQLNLTVYNAYVWMVYPPIVMILVLMEYLLHQIYRHRSALKQDAETDSLTGIPNRRHFIDRSEQILAMAQGGNEATSLLFVDADHFKSINDRFGHRCGDTVLRTVADRIRQMIRGTDIIARFGGEEFVILMPNTAERDAREVAERIRRHVADAPIDACSGSRSTVGVTVSVGVATARRTGPGLTLRELLNAADSALYAAKSGGRNRVEYGVTV